MHFIENNCSQNINLKEIYKKNKQNNKKEEDKIFDSFLSQKN